MEVDGRPKRKCQYYAQIKSYKSAFQVKAIGGNVSEMRPNRLNNFVYIYMNIHISC